MEKPLLLKDYLLDDMSSCSSTGFRSFPRRKCCGNLGFTCEFDFTSNSKQQKNKISTFRKTETKSKSAMTAIQAVISAVKRLPFSTARSPEKKTHNRSTFIPHKLVKKKSSLWKRRKPDQKEVIGRRTNSDQASESSNHSPTSFTTGESKGNSWSGSDFTSVNFYSEVNLNLHEEPNGVVPKTDQAAIDKTEKVITPNDDVSTESPACSGASASPNCSTMTTKKRSSDAKEQFSPISVLDPGFDDEDEVSSPFQNRLARIEGKGIELWTSAFEGTKKKPMRKIQSYESLSKLEPSNLDKRFLLHQDYNHYSTFIDETSASDMEVKEDETATASAECKAIALLHRMRAAAPQSYECVLKLNAKTLLIHLFLERIDSGSGSPLTEDLVQEAWNWMNNECHRMEFDVQRNKETYVKEMEKVGQWRKWGEENLEVVGDLESELFDELLMETVMEMVIV